MPPAVAEATKAYRVDEDVLGVFLAECCVFEGSVAAVDLREAYERFCGEIGEKPLNASWFWRHVWEPLLKKADVRHVRVHDARHTYASLMLRRGVPVAYVSRQLGHSSIQVTVDLYGHFIPGEDRHHVEGLAAILDSARTEATSDGVEVSPKCPDGAKA